MQRQHSASSSTARKLCNRPHGPRYSPAATTSGTGSPCVRAHSRCLTSCKAGDHPLSGHSAPADRASAAGGNAASDRRPGGGRRHRGPAGPSNRPCLACDRSVTAAAMIRSGQSTPSRSAQSGAGRSRREPRYSRSHRVSLMRPLDLGQNEGFGAPGARPARCPNASTRVRPGRVSEVGRSGRRRSGFGRQQRTAGARGALHSHASTADRTSARTSRPRRPPARGTARHDVATAGFWAVAASRAPRHPSPPQNFWVTHSRLAVQPQNAFAHQRRRRNSRSLRTCWRPSRVGDSFTDCLRKLPDPSSRAARRAYSPPGSRAGHAEAARAPSPIPRQVLYVEGGEVTRTRRQASRLAGLRRRGSLASRGSNIAPSRERQEHAWRTGRGGQNRLRGCRQAAIPRSRAKR